MGIGLIPHVNLFSTGSWPTAVGTWFGLLIIALCARMFYNVFLHPLRKYPGPKLWAASRLPWCWHQYNGTVHERIRQMRLRYGSPVRIGPNEIVYTTDTAWKTIYGQRAIEMGKDPIFSITNPSGVKNILSADRPNHSRQRRLLSHAFSEKALRGQEDIILAHVGELIKRLSEVCSSGPVDMVAWLNFITYDVIGDLSFAMQFHCVDKGDYDPFVQCISKGTKELMVTQMLKYYRLFGLSQLLRPEAKTGSRADNLKRSRERVESRIESDTDRKDFLHYILGADEEKGMTRPEIIANAYTLVVGGSDSTASWLSGTVYHVLSHPHVHKRLVEELRSRFKSEDEIRLSTTYNLEYLDAVGNEVMRMYPPVPTVLPRATPSGGEVIDGMFVPAGTTVGVHHYAAYRSPDNFHRPNEFLPERWLPAHRDSPPFDTDNKACFQPFSFGPRGCLGKNLARAEMRLIISRLFWRFDLELIGDQENWVQEQSAFGLWRKTPLMCKVSPAK